ncbi:MAG: GntR family transcriptional regulator [Flavobacteriaceae bacterium]
MIKRKSLRSLIIEALWQLIIEGKLAPNEPLREVHLAELLNVSRTPLREALQKLEWEGIVTSQPGKGFRLSELSVQEVTEIYPLRAKLESFALELAGIPSTEILNELVVINKKMSQTSSSRELVELDESWHEILISGCMNKKLMKMIKVLHRQSQRYEYAYMDIRNTAETSIAQHEKIIAHLKEGNLSEASRLLAENNMVGVEALTDWLISKI